MVMPKDQMSARLLYLIHKATVSKQLALGHERAAILTDVVTMRTACLYGLGAAIYSSNSCQHGVVKVGYCRTDKRCWDMHTLRSAP